jgi:hypothetical protein
MTLASDSGRIGVKTATSTVAGLNFPSAIESHFVNFKIAIKCVNICRHYDGTVKSHLHWITKEKTFPEIV